MIPSEYRHSRVNPYHISVGGVVYDRDEKDQIQVVVLGRREKDGNHYHLPKGTLRHNETLEDCARREVKEESGYEVEIKELLGGFTQNYKARDGLAVEKTTLYFAMKQVGKIGEHDAEHDFVKKMEINEAISKLKETEPKKKEYEIVERLKYNFERRKDA